MERSRIELSIRDELPPALLRNGDELLVQRLLIDEGEMDWKTIAIDAADPLASKINTVEDVEKHMPGKVASIIKWFKYYKVPDGKPVNEFAFDDSAKDADFAMDILELTHKSWASSASIKDAGLWIK